jgi:cellulose synthase/poly-beta-1,6-N-acetylglucosamine synthase-like glycosyltransferase
LLGGSRSYSKNDKFNKVSSRVSVLVPCFNEEDFVKLKVANLKDLDYPGELLEIYFLDGASTDRTVEMLKEETKDLGDIKVIETGLRGKIGQINSFIPKLDTDIVINTDMDTLMERDVILKLVRIFEEDNEVAVAGAHVMPKGGMEMELQYWEDQNLARFLESKVHSSSIVIAPCYAFRLSLLKSFPEDCIADDIYVSFLANSKGQKSKYIEDAMVYETRTPTNLEEVLKHKFRKGNAYIIELLRFLYMLPVMEPRWKVIYLTKFIQVIIMPWVIPFFMLSTVSQLLSGIEAMKLPAFALTFLFFSLLITHVLFSRGRKVFLTKRHKKRIFLTVFAITNLILFINGLTFPFYMQTSSYSKVNMGK